LTYRSLDVLMPGVGDDVLASVAVEEVDVRLSSYLAIASAAKLLTSVPATTCRVLPVGCEWDRLANCKTCAPSSISGGCCTGDMIADLLASLANAGAAERAYAP
jgi:hypothetical protein